MTDPEPSLDPESRLDSEPRLDPESRLGTGPHPYPDTLADLHEGVLDPPGAANVRRHLESCAPCKARFAALSAVPALLAAAADAGPVPPAVALRLDHALAVADHQPAVATTPTVVPLAPGRNGARGMQLLQAAAVVVVTFALGGLLLSVLPRGSDNVQTGAGSGRSAAVPEASAAAPAQVTASGRDWTPESLPAGVRDLVAGRIGPTVLGYAANGTRGTQPTPGPSAPTTATDARRRLPANALADPAGLRSCVTRLADTQTRAVAVDLAKFRGRPAAVIVLPDPAAQDSLFVYVVAPSCPAGTFLYFAQVPRS